MPLGEETEAYQVRIIKDGTVLREEAVTAPVFDYREAAQIGDGLVVPFQIEVAQVSASYGRGLATRTDVTAL